MNDLDPRAHDGATARRTRTSPLAPIPVTSPAGAAPDVAHNRILAALPAATTERLLPHLEPVSLQLREVITEAREAARHVIFPVGAVLSLVTPLADRSAVEMATVGN